MGTALIRPTGLHLPLCCVAFFALFFIMLYYMLETFFYITSFLCSFLRVTAISYQNKSLSYSLLTNPSGLFSVGQATGDISLTRNVDYESDQHQYLLVVRAEENEEQLSSAAEVGVHFCHSVCICVFLESSQIPAQIH